MCYFPRTENKNTFAKVLKVQSCCSWQSIESVGVYNYYRAAKVSSNQVKCLCLSPDNNMLDINVPIYHYIMRSRADIDYKY